MFGLTAEAREAGAGRLELFTGGQEAAGQSWPEQNQNFECQEERGKLETEDEQEVGVSHITYRPTLPKDFEFQDSRGESQDSRGEEETEVKQELGVSQMFTAINQNCPNISTNFEVT